MMSQHLKIWLVKIHFDFKIQFRPIHNEQLSFYASTSLNTKSYARIKRDCHHSITWYFYYWWSFHCTSIRQTYLYSISFFQFCFLFSFIIHLLLIFSSLESCSVFKNISEALSIPDWTQAMQEEMAALKHNRIWEESRWLQMSLHYQVKHRWVSGSLKSENDCQRLLTCVWAGLCEQLLPGRKVDICVNPCLISSDIPLATSSVGHQEYLPQWYSWWGGLHEATTRLCYSKGVCEGLHIEEVTLRSETISESLVWALYISDSEV